MRVGRRRLGGGRGSLGALLTLLLCGAAVAAEPPESVRAEGLVFRVELACTPPEEASREVQRVPGFEVRGFQDAVCTQKEMAPPLDLVWEAGAEGGEVLLRLRNISGDLVTVLALTPAPGSPGLPWKAGLKLPIELDLEETAVLLAGKAEAYRKIGAVQLTAKTEEGAELRWRAVVEAEDTAVEGAPTALPSPPSGPDTRSHPSPSPPSRP